MKRFLTILCCLALVFSLLACSSEVTRDGGAKYAANEDYSSPENGWSESEKSASESDSSALTERKQIFRYDLSLKTSSFDELTDRIRGEAKALGGFVESMDQDQYGDYRYLTLTVRIPAEKAEAFVEGVAGSAVVTSRGQSSEDVTLEYVDVETRLKNLEAERQALAAMMERAETVEDLITIQTRLSDVQYEIESYTARRNKIDELVGLSTVSFRIQEVAREEDVATPEEGIWGKIGAGFMNNLRSLGEFFRDLFANFVMAIPFLIIPVAIILIIFFSIRHAVRKKRKAEREKRQAFIPPQPPQAPQA